MSTVDHVDEKQHPIFDNYPSDLPESIGFHEPPALLWGMAEWGSKQCAQCPDSSTWCLVSIRPYIQSWVRTGHVHHLLHHHRNARSTPTHHRNANTTPPTTCNATNIPPNLTHPIAHLTPSPGSMTSTVPHSPCLVVGRFGPSA